jgi:hypothetical protein
MRSAIAERSSKTTFDPIALGRTLPWQGERAGMNFEDEYDYEYDYEGRWRPEDTKTGFRRTALLFTFRVANLQRATKSVGDIAVLRRNYIAVGAKQKPDAIGGPRTAAQHAPTGERT